MLFITPKNLLKNGFLKDIRIGHILYYKHYQDFDITVPVSLSFGGENDVVCEPTIYFKDVKVVITNFNDKYIEDIEYLAEKLLKTLSGE